MAKKKDLEDKVEAVATPTASEGSTEPVTLTINDLQLLGQIVDLASQRGAFRAAEFEQVGAAYTKLTSFLKFVADAQEKEKAEAESATA